MKRDMDVVRKIVLALRDSDRAMSKLEGLDEAQYLMHAQLLIEADLAHGAVAKSGSSTAHAAAVILFRLTWAGHDFADAIVDDTLWKKAKDSVIKPGAAWTFGVLGEWLKVEIKARLGLPP